MKRYLVCIDDDRQVLEALRKDLDPELQRGYQLEFCESAQEADELLGEIEHEGSLLALMVCDQVMPGEGGVQFLERVTRRHPEVKKILLTGYAGLDNATFGINRAKLDRYLNKPWSVDELRAAVRELLDDFEREHYGDIFGIGDLYNLGDFQRRDGADLYAKANAFASWWTEMSEVPMWERPLASPCRPVVNHRRRPDQPARAMVMLGGNSYLDLTTHPKIKAATKAAIEKFGIGTGGAPLLSGTFEMHKQLEEALCRFKGGEACCIFPSGYSANVGIISGLARETDTVFLDELVHASIVDGAKMSRARVRLFRHNDVEDLADKLKSEDKRSTNAGKLIVVDAVYSMDGDIAPLPAIVELGQRFGAKVMVDEAHSTGVIGERGHGIGEHFDMAGKIDIVMGTFSKTLGAVGGFCIAPKSVVEYLRFYARSHMFSTSLPPATVASTLAALQIIDEEPERVLSLRANHQHFRSKLKALGLNTRDSETAIIPVVIGDNATLWRMARELDDAGFYVNAVPFPAVPKELSRLRFSLMATHSREDLDRAVDALTVIGRKYHLVS